MDLKEVKKDVIYTTIGDRLAITKTNFEWLIKQAEIVSKIKGFCEHEADTYGELKLDETRHKVDSIFFNGKQRGFSNVRSYIENLEES